MAHLKDRFFLVPAAKADKFFKIAEDWDAVVLDVETTGLSPYHGSRLMGLALTSLNDPKSYYLPIDHPDWEDPFTKNQIDHLFTRVLKGKPLIGWNIKFDLHFLSLFLGKNISEGRKLADGIVAARILSRENHPELSLDRQAALWLGYIYTSDPEDRKKFASGQVSVDQIGLKSCEDVHVTRELYKLFKEKMDETERQLYALECRLTKILFNMEYIGVRVDSEEAKELDKQLERIQQEIVEFIERETGLKGINPLSVKDVGRIMEALGIEPVKRTAKGNPSWTRKVVDSLDHPVAKKIGQYRALQHVRSNSLEAIINANGVLHGTYQNWGTVTGRMSARDPNIQAIPKGFLQMGDDHSLVWSEDGPDKTIGVRRLFKPRPGYFFLAVDYRQIEMFVAGWLLKDPGFLDLLQHEDIHAATAKWIWGEVDSVLRKRAKTLNFGLLYGMGPKALAQNLGVSEQEAKKYQDEYFSRFTTYWDTMRKIERKLEKRGYVENAFGRKYWLPPDQARVAFNYLIQGSAGDFVKFQLVRLEGFCNDTGIRPLMTTHDDITFEVPYESKGYVPKLLSILEDGEAVFGMKLPVEAKYSYENLADLEPWDASKEEN